MEDRLMIDEKVLNSFENDELIITCYDVSTCKHYDSSYYMAVCYKKPLTVFYNGANTINYAYFEDEGSMSFFYNTLRKGIK